MRVGGCKRGTQLNARGYISSTNSCPPHTKHDPRCNKAARARAVIIDEPEIYIHAHA